jgi:Zn finger protein HypA/HybF involved in hydrogenase expression
VELVSIRCLSCEQGWTTVAAFSVYEQQAQESCPCPSCGAYTLSVADPEADEVAQAR